MSRIAGRGDTYTLIRLVDDYRAAEAIPRRASRSSTACKEPGTDGPAPNIHGLPPCRRCCRFSTSTAPSTRINQKRIASVSCAKEDERAAAAASRFCGSYSPVTGCDCVDMIPHEALVYDCVDRHSAYGGLMNPALVDAMELELAAKADMTFATAGICSRALEIRAAGGGQLYSERGKLRAILLRRRSRSRCRRICRALPAPDLRLCRRAADLHRVWLRGGGCEGETGLAALSGSANEKPGADCQARCAQWGTYYFLGRQAERRCCRSIWRNLTCASNLFDARTI